MKGGRENKVCRKRENYRRTTKYWKDEPIEIQIEANIKLSTKIIDGHILRKLR